MASSRFIPNDFSPLFRLGDTSRYFKHALEDIVTNFPPRDVYHHEMLSGLWHGPTGISYLLLHVAHSHPDLRIAGHHALTWSRAYIKGERRHVHLESSHCGIASEKLAFDAVRASITKDIDTVRDFVSLVPAILDGDYPNEMLYGRAGTLYLLRMIRHWVPESAPLVDHPISQISHKILYEGTDWRWHGKRYLGAVHGDIGIVTQLVLSMPSLASQLESKLDRLLLLQLDDGNWQSSEGREGTPYLTQFCHGAPGFVLSLISLRPYFPRLQDRIDRAITSGRECIWTQGLLRKEPSLCHGIFSNALALPSGPQRSHFLAIATPEKISEMTRDDSTLFKPADYGTKNSTTASYGPSAAWTWLVHMREYPKIIAYNDV